MSQVYEINIINDDMANMQYFITLSKLSEYLENILYIGTFLPHLEMIPSLSRLSTKDTIGTIHFVSIVTYVMRCGSHRITYVTIVYRGTDRINYVCAGAARQCGHVIRHNQTHYMRVYTVYRF